MNTENAPTIAAVPLRLEFTGHGSEYFGIWVVNLLLTLLTLGIYSAWAKVRRLRYFYQHTGIAGSSFEYHGNPLAILKGRILALLLVLAYNFSIRISLMAYLITLALLLMVMPWLMRQSFRFRLHNSSYRGLRFGFDGGVAGAYKTFLGYGLLTLVTFYLAAPLFHQRLKQYQHGNSRFGASRFRFDATVGQFYRAYALVLGLSLMLVLGSGAALGTMVSMFGKTAGKPSPELVAGLMAMMVGILLIGSLFIAPLWRARTQNLIWNHTRLDAHVFRSEVKAWPLLGLMLSNFLMVLLTLGLFIPWAHVRMARYLASCLSLLPAGSLDEFLAATQAAEVPATGDAATEFFDFDIGL